MLHSSSLTEVITKQWQKPRLVCTWVGRQSAVAGLQILFSLLSSESFPSFLEKIAIIWEGVIIPALFSLRKSSGTKAIAKAVL